MFNAKLFNFSYIIPFIKYLKKKLQKTRKQLEFNIKIFELEFINK